MSRKIYSLNHSRNLMHRADDIGYAIVENERSKPTEKQKKYFSRLIMLCKENNIDSALPIFAVTRFDFSRVIDILRARLASAGVDPGGNSRAFSHVIEISENKYGDYEAREKLVENS